MEREKMKKALSGLGLLFFIFIIIFLWNQFVNIEPPKPILMVDGKKVFYSLGTYSWSNGNQSIDADAGTPGELVKGLDYTVVRPFSNLSINFKHEPSNLEVGIWKNNSVSFKKVTNHTLKFPAEQGDYVYVLLARWEEGEAIYAFPIKIVAIRG